MKKLLLLLFLSAFCLLLGETVLEENFDTGIIPTDWSQEFVDGNISWSISNGGYNGHPESAHSGFYNALFFANSTDGNTTRLISPQFNLGINEVGTLTFYHAQQDWVGYQDELRIYYKNSVDGEWNLLSTFTTNTAAWTMRQIVLPNPSTTYYIAFEGYAEYGYGVCIDNIHIDGDPMYNDDLQGIAISGPGNVTAGNSESYAVTVFNAGIQPQNNYEITLYKEGDIQIGNAIINDEIAPGVSENHYVVWNIPENQEEAYIDIYAEIILASDENIYNNTTPTMTVHVSPPGTQYLIEEGFEGGELPAGWSEEFISGSSQWQYQAGGQSGNPGSAHTGSYNAAFLHSTTGNITRLLTPEMNLGTANPGTLNFWHTQAIWASDQDELYIYYKNSPTGQWVLLESYTENITEWTERTITLPNPSPNYQVAFEAHDEYGYGVCLDDIEIIGNPTVFDNDLAALQVTGSTIVNAGNTENYEVQIKNVGDLPQDNYTVKLMKAGNAVLDTQEINTALQPGEISVHNLVWNISPTEPSGLTSIWAEVELENDENTFNNTSPDLTIEIFPQGIYEVMVGDGTETNNRLPICFQYLNSLTESIYLSTEMNNTTGHINAITYYNNFSSNLMSKPTKIWMGETSLATLADGWIPASQLTLVFDGFVSYPSGENPITINLDSQYYYSGNNLVVMVHRPMDTDTFGTTDFFYLTETPDIMDRTRYERDDTIVLDPYSPPDGYSFEKFPNTKFTFFQGEMGDVQGYVYDDQGDPLENAAVTIIENQQMVYTDETGFFHIGNVLTGTYQFEASLYGYDSQTLIDEITYQDTLTLSFELSPLGVVNVSGRVVGSDFPSTGLTDATVSLTGFGDYEATTDSQGYFDIPGVYTNQYYTLTAQHSDYSETVMDINVEGTDLELGQITLNERTSPPTNVHGTQNNAGTIVELSWNSPGVGGSEFRYDDGNPVNLMGFSNTYANAVFGSVFPYNSIIEEVQWQLSDQYEAHNNVKLLILGLDSQNLPESEDVLLFTNNIPNMDDQWNTYTLQEPITAPNGFFLGVITPNLYTGIALDDGIGAPWEYIPGRQLACSDWTIETPQWEQIGNAGFSNNMLIRGYGYNYGEVRNFSEKLASPIIEQDRSFESYSIYRFIDYNHYYPEYWTLVEEGITDTSFTDLSWSALDPENYQYAITAVHTNGVESIPSFSNVILKTTLADSDDNQIPVLENKLISNIPNPFNPQTTIKFSLTETSEPVKITIYNNKGQKICTLLNEIMPSGLHSIIWDGNDERKIPVGSGIYFCRFSVGTKTISTRKMLLLK